MNLTFYKEKTNKLSCYKLNESTYVLVPALFK